MKNLLIFFLFITFNCYSQYSLYISKALSFAQSKNIDSSEYYFKKAYLLAPKKIEAVYGLGYIYSEYCYKAGTKCSEAIHFLSLAQKIDPTYRHQNYNLAVCYFEIGEKEKALIHINKAISKTNNDPDYYIKRASIRYSLNDKKGSCEDLKSAQNMGRSIPEAAKYLNYCN